MKLKNLALALLTLASPAAFADNNFLMFCLNKPDAATTLNFYVVGDELNDDGSFSVKVVEKKKGTETERNQVGSGKNEGKNLVFRLNNGFSGFTYFTVLFTDQTIIDPQNGVEYLLGDTTISKTDKKTGKTSKMEYTCFASR